MWLELTLIFATATLLLTYFKERSKNNYWDQYGIPSIDTSKFANSLELVLGLKDTLQIDSQVYKEMGKSKFYGIIEAGTPAIMVKDLDLAKNIMIKDFDHFVDRRILFKSSKSPALQKMLPSLEGHEWRGVRVSMSPTFTTGKMRRLMDCFNNCGVEWMSSLKSKSSEEIDMKNSSARFALDVIASAVFGMEAGSIKSEHSIFLQNAKYLGDSSYSSIVKQALALHFPKIFKMLNLNAFDDSPLEFFDNILSHLLKARESGEMSGRNDFLQLIVEARKGALKRESTDELSTFEKDAKLSDEAVLEKNSRQCILDDDVAKGQGFIFFFAGYHGIAMTITYAAHTLAYHQDIQKKLRDELKGKFDKDGKIWYDDMNHLVYMEMFLSELLRFYPITPRLERVCGKTYENSKLGLTIPKGTIVEIPVAEIHRDPRYYANPEKFDPEHFSAESKANRHPYAYMPFGHGPRNCIGIRFAQVEVKTAIAHLVHNFLIEPVRSSPFPIKTVLVGHGIQIPGAVDIKLTPIN